MSKNPEYTVRHDLPTIKRGDTIESFSMTVAVNKGTDDEELVIPDAICAQLRDKDDTMLHVFAFQIDPATGIEAYINNLPEPVQTEARIEWEKTAVIERDNPLLAQIAEMMQWDDERLDEMFTEASKL